MPLMLAADTDVPELPERCHGALVTYAVARERAAGDATAAAQTGFALYHQMRRTATALKTRTEGVRPWPCSNTASRSFSA